jgi:Na+/H+-dicarboxylate symporter
MKIILFQPLFSKVGINRQTIYKVESNYNNRGGIIMGKQKDTKKSGYTLVKGIAIAAILGLVAGLIFGEKMEPFQVIGNLFLRIMQMPILLLIMTAVMLAVGELRPKELGRIGGKTLMLFVASTVMAAVFGLITASILKPGVGLDVTGFANMQQVVEVPETAGITDQILGFFSTNMFNSMASGNTIQVIVIALFFGTALSIYGSKHEENPVLDGIRNINDIVMQLIFIVVQGLPLAVFSFISYAVGVLGSQVISVLAKIIIANLLGAIGMTIIWLIIVGLYCKVSPIKIAPRLVRTIIINLVSASSAVSLPVKMEDGEKKLGISPRINNLVAPLGMSMNTDGAVLFFTLSALTIAQIYGITLGSSQLLSLVIASTFISFGAITVPGGGLVMLAIVLSSVGLPVQGMVIISAADFLLGPIRTVNNNIDDMLIGMLVAKSEDELNYEVFNQKSSFLS